MLISFEADYHTQSKCPPRDERWRSIGRKPKQTDLIGLANVDGMGLIDWWDGIDGIDRLLVEVFGTYHYHNHSYEYLRVTSFKSAVFALFTVVLRLLLKCFT